MPDMHRRRLLAALALSPLGLNLPLYATASSPPAVNLNRIIALEWLPIELLLILGVTPLAVVESHGYKNWVGYPPVPPDSIDVGLRTEPNLELITGLKPSLIVCSQGYGPPIARLTPIAPVLALSYSDERGKPLTRSRVSLLQLAQRIGRISQAQAYLNQLDHFFASLKHHLARQIKRPILLISLLDERHTMVFGRGSLFLDVMQTLGLANAWQGETNFWGSEIISIERLSAFDNVDVLCFSHDDHRTMDRLAQTPLWQAMPFVRQQRFKRIPPIWFYGGPAAAMRFGQLLSQVLEAA